MYAALLLVIPLSVAVLLVLLAVLSARLGAVLRRPPHYRWFFVGGVMVMAGTAFWVAFDGPGRPLLGLWAILPVGLITAGLLTGLLTAWLYWGWLPYE